MSNAKDLDVLRIALQQYGYTEDPPGSNRNKFGKAYGWNGVAWCAEFVWWAGEQPQGDNPIYKSANAADIQDLTVSRKGGKYILPQTANNSKKKAALPKLRPGDNVSFNFSGGSSRQHTGMVVGVWVDSVYCIEGNTSFSDRGSQSNGGCVALRKRDYTDCVCVDRPKYKRVGFYHPATPYAGELPTLPSQKNRRYFKYGDKSPEIKKLRQALAWANGYNLKSGKKFGSFTFAEVVIFQLANGLEPDGIFGKASLAKLKQIVKEQDRKEAA